MTGQMQEVIDILTESEPEASAAIRGSRQYPGLSGNVLFYPFWDGSLVFVNVFRLPDEEEGGVPCSDKMYAFHIHEGEHCTGTEENPFADAGGHYNPEKCPHPFHAGDMPVILSGHGFALQIFYTNRFTPREVIGKTAIIHLHPDDYRTQPSGNAGMMIACGEIKTGGDISI